MLIDFSIVSHNQFFLVNGILDDLESITDVEFRVILTSNTVEDHNINLDRSYPIKYICNLKVLGFGANHNQAFKHSIADYFIILNPDIRFKNICFLSLISNFTSNLSVGIVAPAVFSSNGKLEDSCRNFPTFSSLLKKLFRLDNQLKLPTAPTSVDWVGGMFMIFERDVFRKINGFDSKRFFMYYEDVDICRKINDLGLKVLYNPTFSIVHDAQRTSRKSFKHFIWHITSMFRYLSGI